ncbi:ATPase H(+)-transporting accessory protein 2 isoform X2 [Polistes fuscatus]|uniref:ATPase H(+)-transporting accessory protein 2 isoform X2 n=1 Tax=Polistes fuscatus TaxID=30207 RepID=UPI001CA94ADA|nr:ATPase H(+)-transporting accessory protein 2 isoform X2 [Polistes fuscatus]
MLNLFICFLITLTGVCAHGEFVVLRSPDSVSFYGNEEIEQSLLKEVFAASLGFTAKQRETWEGISITDPFSLPEAVVSIVVEGVDTLDITNGIKFHLNDDEIEETTWQAISRRLAERDNDNTLVRIYLGDGLDALGQSALGELKPIPIDESSFVALRLTNEEDRKFLEEIQLLRAIAKKVPTAIKADDKSDVYWLVISGLRPVLDLHGKNSTAAKEAFLLLNDALNDISDAFMKVYDNKVLIAAFTNDPSQVRHTRSISSNRQRRETQQADQEEENRNISDEENIDTNIHSTSEINTDVSSTTEYSDTNADSGSTEKSEQDLAKMENKINTNTKSVGQQADQEEENRNISDEENIDTNIHSASKINTKVNSTTEYSDVNTNNGNTEKSGQDFTNMENQIDINKINVGQDEWNHAKYYSSNYPVIFNIFLWFGVVFVFSLLAICIAIADMDPGRDSIIYRMTSNRMKKDN